MKMKRTTTALLTVAIGLSAGLSGAQVRAVEVNGDLGELLRGLRRSAARTPSPSSRLAPAASREGADEALLRSIKEGDPVEVRNALAGGADVNRRLFPGNATPLMIATYEYGSAARGGDPRRLRAVFDLLVAAPGVDVNAATVDGHTALMYACVDGSAELVDALIARGAAKGLRSRDGDTALTRTVRSRIFLPPDATAEESVIAAAIASGQLRSVQALLADPDLTVNELDGFGLSALMWAVDVRRDQPAYAAALIGAGADPMLIGRSGRSALALVESLMSEAPASGADRDELVTLRGVLCEGASRDGRASQVCSGHRK